MNRHDVRLMRLCTKCERSYVRPPNRLCVRCLRKKGKTTTLRASRKGRNKTGIAAHKPDRSRIKRKGQNTTIEPREVRSAWRFTG